MKWLKNGIELLKLTHKRRDIFLHLIIILSAFLAGFFEAKTILVFNNFLSDLKIGEAELLIKGAILYFVFFFLDILISLIRDVTIENGRFNLIYSLRNFSIIKLFKGNWEHISVFQKGKTNEVIVNDIETTANTVWKDFFNFISTLFSTMWLIFAVYTISNFTITFIVLGIIVPVLIMQSWFAKKINIFTGKTRDEKWELNERIYTLKDGLFSLRAVKREDWLLSRTHKQLKKFQNEVLRSNKFELMSETVSEIVYVISIFAITIVGWTFVKNSSLAVEAFVTIFIYSGRVTYSFQSLYYIFITLVKNSHSVTQILQFSKIPLQDTTGQNTSGEINSIDIKQLCYKYPSADKFTLQNIEFSIKHGITSIVGNSGVGKSTLLEILLKLRMPSSGKILINGLPLDEIDTEKWLENISFVSQNPYVMNDTLLNNVSFGRDVSDEDILEALSKVGLTEWVDSLPDGLHTQIGSENIRPSGGQLKRIAIARAWVGNPQFIILDEPTSSLDKTSSASLMILLKAISNKIPLLITSHDQEFVSNVSDQIVDLNKKEVMNWATF